MVLSRRRKLKANTISSAVFQVTTIICGIILPRLILEKFGSDVNGLVNSIKQFLSVVAFLELGVGAVVQSSLYKPLADNDSEQISRVIKSADVFFAKLALILLFYIIVLIFLYPHLSNNKYEFAYTAILIIAISISSFAQYYFGMVDRLLLLADQRGYIQYWAQTVTLILNVIACIILMEIGASIHMVKLTTSIIYLLRPILLRYYVNRNYVIDRKIKYRGEPIQQKWNGVAQHIAAFVLDGTDVIVLTTFSTLANVSIYSVYNLVVYGVKNLFFSMTNGFQSLMGEMLAKKELDNLRSFFGWTEWLIHTAAVIVFGCVSVLIIPFVQVYTNGVTDVNYCVPAFAILITLANGWNCLRLPYNILILAAGHYKQTQSNFIFIALLNIIVSVITVRAWGLVGVAIGTLVAMIYQTVWMAEYGSKNILNISVAGFVKHACVDMAVFIIAYCVTAKLQMNGLSYFAWLKLAIIDFAVWCVVSLIMNLLLYGQYIMKILEIARKRVLKTK